MAERATRPRSSGYRSWARSPCTWRFAPPRMPEIPWSTASRTALMRRSIAPLRGKSGTSSKALSPRPEPVFWGHATFVEPRHAIVAFRKRGFRVKGHGSQAPSVRRDKNASPERAATTRKFRGNAPTRRDLKMKRRDFLKVSAAGAAATAAVASPAIAQSSAEIKWRMTSSFPKSLDTIYGGGEQVAKYVAEMTDNKFQIQVFAAGEIVPGLQALDATSNGTV